MSNLKNKFDLIYKNLKVKDEPDFENTKALDDFLLLLVQLQNDFIERKDEWKNLTIPHFIDSIIGYIIDSDMNLSEVEVEKLTRIFWAGKHYE
jgi:hypothetical protein